MDEQSPMEQQRDEAGRIITSGSISRAVWYLAWPTIVNTVIITAYILINRAFLGRLGAGAADALAAVGIGDTVLFIQFAVTIGLSVGTSALVARFLGARQSGDAEEATRQSLFLAVIGGIITAAPLIIWADSISGLMGASSTVSPLAANYLAIVAYSSIPSFIYIVVTAALRSAGDVRRPLYAGAAVIAINTIFDYLLIFGIGPFPRLEVAGAAISTGISRIVGMALILWFLNRSILRESLRQLKVHFGWFRRILNIGWPAMAQNLMWSGASLVLVALVGRLPDGTVAIAALTLGLAIEAMAYMPGVAYATAVTPLVGQNLGAGQPERAERSAWVSAWQAIGFMTIVAVFFVVIPKQLSRAFTSYESVVALTASYLLINSVSEPFLALGMVLRGALQGAGDVRVPALITFTTFWVVRLPLVWLLAEVLSMGAIGAWIAISGSTILSGIMTWLWFRTGRWKTVKM
jgi:putative MATE family efflux protein